MSITTVLAICSRDDIFQRICITHQSSRSFCPGEDSGGSTPGSPQTRDAACVLLQKLLQEALGREALRLRQWNTALVRPERGDLE